MLGGYNLLVLTKASGLNCRPELQVFAQKWVVAATLASLQ